MTTQACPVCGFEISDSGIKIVAGNYEITVCCDDCAQKAAESSTKDEREELDCLPDRIGRYRIDRELGRGGFGVVFLACDEQLCRPVAVKVPNSRRVVGPEHAEPYLTEARIVAGLEHPHIVPVYDVGSAPEFPFFIVSRYIDGTNLATQLKESRLSRQLAVEIVGIVAEALHYAHTRGLVHRDVKPANILIDGNGKPHLVDFGLALREEKVGKGPRYIGTPAYMSPEQARGEGHRVDGRSDVFSLGVILYELLVGSPPFRGATLSDVLEQVTDYEPPQPSQCDKSIPTELERICLKALSKPVTERYATAQDLADDLKDCLDHPSLGANPRRRTLRPGISVPWLPGIG